MSQPDDLVATRPEEARISRVYLQHKQRSGLQNPQLLAYVAGGKCSQPWRPRK